MTALAAAVGDTIAHAFPTEVWIRGEIVGCSKAASGHIYFSLAEPGARSSRRSARMQVALFRNSQRQVDRDLAAAGGLTLADGIEVRIRAAVEYYPGRGQVQLVMSGVDPHFTLGALAAERARTLAELEATGLLRRNAAVPVAAVPLRIGLITAARSAAHADFVHELASSGYAFEMLLCDARVQGITAETDLIAALGTLNTLDIDVIALVRGGGDRNDLLVFDLASVAKAIARCRLPVFCGIGHETDSSVADQVAHTSAKTPTACAAQLVARVTAFEARLDRAAREVDRTARARAATAVARLEAAGSQLRLLAERRAARPRALLNQAELLLAHRAQQHLAGARSRLRSAGGALGHLAVRHTADARARLDSAAAVVAAMAPQRTLARGFTITRTLDGAVVREMPRVGDIVITQTASATFASAVHATPPEPTGDARLTTRERGIP